MSSSTDDLIWTDDRLKKITSEDGRRVNFWNGLDYDDRQKLKDHHVMDVLTNHVNADLVTNIRLDWCRGITNGTLIQISNMCPQLERLSVNGCEMITDDGIVPIAEKCGQQLKQLSFSYCKKCTDAALKSVVNNCNQLEGLDANDCGISTIPENIGNKLTKLKQLDLRHNKITKIPVSLLTLLKDTLKDVDISGNPLQVPPSEIAKQEGFAAIKRYFEVHVPTVEPEDCKIMISFNTKSAGPDAERLTNRLTSEGHPTFCTMVYCKNMFGDWRDITEMGALTCKIYIVLMTRMWQDSGECQIETRHIKNRLGDNEVIVIPVWYDSFDKEYDNRRGHNYWKTWKSYQGVFMANAGADKDYLVNTILEMFSSRN
jgi:hypothetical protein